MPSCYRCGATQGIEEIEGPYGPLFECNECYEADEAEKRQWEYETATNPEIHEQERKLTHA